MPRKTRSALPEGPFNCSFNEAAARCRGKLSASPRRLTLLTWRFNEAAARCRGKHRQGLTLDDLILRFNEAAARCRGKRGAEVGVFSLDQPASMRPRPDAAENTLFLSAPARISSRLQ